MLLETCRHFWQEFIYIDFFGHVISSVVGLGSFILVLGQPGLYNERRGDAVNVVLSVRSIARRLGHFPFGGGRGKAFVLPKNGQAKTAM